MADEPARKHGHRGLHVRDAARRCALGIHPEGGRGGDLQTPPGVTGRSETSASPRIRRVNWSLKPVRDGGKVAQRGLSYFIAFLPRRRKQAALLGENKV